MSQMWPVRALPASRERHISAGKWVCQVAESNGKYSLKTLILSGFIIGVISASVGAGIAYGGLRADVDAIATDRAKNPDRYVAQRQFNEFDRRISGQLADIKATVCEMRADIKELRR